jgi:hypothetical protein
MTPGSRFCPRQGVEAGCPAGSWRVQEAAGQSLWREYRSQESACKAGTAAMLRWDADLRPAPARRGRSSRRSGVCWAAVRTPAWSRRERRRSPGWSRLGCGARRIGPAAGRACGATAGTALDPAIRGLGNGAPRAGRIGARAHGPGSFRKLPWLGSPARSPATAGTFRCTWCPARLLSPMTGHGWPATRARG